jgi:diguanylate cyclase (GGDEF)-like protein
MTLQNLISLALFTAFVIYAMAGAYGLSLNKDERLNRLFALLCLCGAIWSFCFAVTNSAETYAEALLFRRISVLGWGVVYSVVLHFVIVLTGADQSWQSKRPVVLAAVYAPAVINVIVFGLWSQMASQQIQLTQTVAGWIALPVGSFFEGLFYCYYLVYSLAAFLVLLRWLSRTKSQIDRKRAFALILAAAVALLLGTFTDAIANHFLSLKLPSLAPLFALLPAFGTYYIIAQTGLTNGGTRDSERTEGVILNTDSRTKLFRYISMILAVAGLFNFQFSVIVANDRIGGVLFCLALVLMSVLMIIIPALVQSVKRQQRLLALLLLLILPVVMLAYFDPQYSNIIWPVPIFIIMITIIFNSRRIFFLVGALSMLMGIILWSRIPRFTLMIGSEEYLLRLLFYLIGICLTAVITNIYFSRLVENRKQREFQQLIAEISTDFVTMTRFDFNDKVENLLRRSGAFIHANRAAVAMFSENFQTVHVTHQWGETADSAPENNRQPVPSWSQKQLFDNQIVYLLSADHLPDEAEEERQMLARRNLQSLVMIPVCSSECTIGFIEFDRVGKNPSWRTEDFEMLRVLATILADAIKKVENEKEMNDLAYYDTLTNLPNRVLFNNRLEQAIDLARRSGKTLGVIFLDLDGFKEVNDSMGHDWGDQLLNRVAKRLSACIRKYDTVARFGGDEFLIMVPQLSQKSDLEDVAEKIMGVFKQPILMGEQEFYINASCGVAVFPDDGESVKALTKNADIAMYEAKKNGKGQVVFCSGEMKKDVRQKLILTSSLHRALEKNELSLHYQPQINAESQEIIGFEALLRWNHGELGLISPAVFIPIAEETGLINSIGAWVLQTACAQNKSWQDQGFTPVKMAVNLSLEQFRNHNLEALVRESLEQTGLEPQYLELEITENIAMRESEDVVACLHRLKALGVEISIDDFGTEFSSLGRLKDLPVDRLKIDIAFIRGISQNTKDETIIAVMIHLAKKLGLKVIAEGVETEVQLVFLKDEACDEIQGYYYYRPLSKDQIESDIYKVSVPENH